MLKKFFFSIAVQTLTHKWNFFSLSSSNTKSLASLAHPIITDLVKRGFHPNVTIKQAHLTQIAPLMPSSNYGINEGFAAPGAQLKINFSRLFQLFKTSYFYIVAKRWGSCRFLPLGSLFTELAYHTNNLKFNSCCFVLTSLCTRQTIRIINQCSGFVLIFFFKMAAKVLVFCTTVQV